MNYIKIKTTKNQIGIILLLCLIIHIPQLQASEQWASKVIDASSQNQTPGYNKNCFSAYQALGKPSVMPDCGETVCAWMPKEIKRNDFIILSYKTPMNVEQVAVAENLNPGAIVKITLYGEGKELLVFSNSDPRPQGKKGRLFNIFCDKTDFKVDRVRIDINTYRYTDNYQIDAVAISDTKDTIVSKINLSADVLEVSDPENLGENVNSRYSELAPVISPDGKTIYYTRERHPDNTGTQSIWYAELGNNGKFQPAKNIGKPLNTPYNNFAISILPDGNSMLVGNTYYPDGRLGNGFSMTYKKGDEWSFPEAVKIKDFYNSGGRGSYCLASSGKVLLASMQRNNGFGGNDLYVSFLQNDGIWSEPMNLGNEINTADREDSPFLAADGVTLYFSSAGYPGYGNSDIYVIKRLDETWKHWSEPVNLGPKINTPEWDAYFTITASGDYAYFVSIKNSLGNEDIFRVKLPQELRPQRVILVSGKVIDKKTKTPVAANIYYEKLSTGENMGIARSNPSDGKYKIALPENEKYGFRAEAKDYMAISENLDFTKLKSNVDEIERDLYLVPIEQGQAITINNLFFDFGQFEVLQESFPELERLAKMMKENNKIKIRIEGHTDNVGSAAANNTLSINRVNAVKDFLINRGIESNRIQTKGLGASKPIATNDTEDGRAKNRRVECIIVSK